MLVRIVKRTFSGAEYCPEQKVLKLGGEGSTGVETLEFELPEEWAGMAVTVHVQQLDGTLPQPVLLGEDRCLEVDRMFTSSEKGLWMLRAMDGNGYCAMTRPARYECYETFTADGDTEITPSQYEAFVAQVLGAANTASQKAKDAQSAADRAEGAAGEAQKAKAAAADSAQQAKGEAESAQTAAERCGRRGDGCGQGRPCAAGGARGPHPDRGVYGRHAAGLHYTGHHRAYGHDRGAAHSKRRHGRGRNARTGYPGVGSAGRDAGNRRHYHCGKAGGADHAAHAGGGQ